MDEYGQVGKLTTKPGQRDALVDLLLEAAQLLRDSPGCHVWLVQESASDPDAVWITESWRSRDDHKASLARPDVRAVIGRAMPLLAGEPSGEDTRPRGGILGGQPL